MGTSMHDSLKAYVCILYASPCAPLLVLWPGEVEGTSLAMAQGKASPVPAPEPMFRVSPVLRRYDTDVPPTAVGACCRRPKCTFKRVFYAVFCGDRTQHNPLSAIAANNRVKNQNWGPRRRLRMAHLVSKPFVTLMSHILTQRAKRMGTLR